MMDTYRISRDSSIIKLNELFYEIKVHEQVNFELKEKYLTLVIEKKKQKDTYSLESKHKSENKGQVSSKSNSWLYEENDEEK